MQHCIREGIISEIKDQKIARRLLSMGILPGEHLYVWRKSIFGGAFYIQVGKQFLALRKNELNQIHLK